LNGGNGKKNEYFWHLKPESVNCSAKEKKKAIDFLAAISTKVTGGLWAHTPLFQKSEGGPYDTSGA
jgi:hypothetical protein